ncbi:Mitochondrial import inner membrane translocase subunit TIM14 [Spironucleus salmonicida]|uniref:Mitochondrial import inner membrane translocase subunit TIM14 n=1 Tax=Spironucleus salmonicida TaxID=348837 RepID=K7R8M1_9EUKA|nr:mitochondrial import inner membrane translocase subunit TIM14 [Spironucleus salmonicida]KAH0577496.1 Mitochondrial import inner membrane translocase subunit TIM14 [Spironucleus salmonicida]|eukprot:EST43528.1 Mitochondrial import inner membrane translocase subunit TIM14 [Spironucleus salmonicida]
MTLTFIKANKYPILASAIVYALTPALPQYPRRFRGEIPEKITPAVARQILNQPIFDAKRGQKNAKILLALNHPDRGGSTFISQLVSQALNSLQ